MKFSKNVKQTGETTRMQNSTCQQPNSTPQEPQDLQSTGPWGFDQHLLSLKSENLRIPVQHLEFCRRKLPYGLYTF